MLRLHLLVINLAFVLISLHVRSQTSDSFVYDGLARTFIVYTPPSYNNGSAFPLVFVLHGFTQTAQNIMDVSGFNQIADTGNFIVVYPNGVGNAWNSNSGFPGGSTADDIGFISALIDTMFSRYGIDTTRVYSCGFSAGGFMSHRLACESSRCYAAVASVAGTMSSTAYSACVPSRPLPVLQIHGTADAVVSYSGGFGGVSVDDVVAKWTGNNICPLTPNVVQLPNIDLSDNSTVESNIYAPCAAASEVKLLKVIGGGHQWPGTTALIGGVGTVNRDINASGEIWNFFRYHTCNGPSSVITHVEKQNILIRPIDADHYFLDANGKEKISISLYDLHGKVLLSGSFFSGSILDASAFPKGFYIITARCGDAALSYRFVR